MSPANVAVPRQFAGSAARPSETTLARLLKQHRIRRIDAATALGILRQPAIRVAAGVTEAAVLHLRFLVVRLCLANQELRTVEDKLDEICAALSKAVSPGGDSAPPDAAILRSVPGVGKLMLAALLTEASGPLGRRDYAALRPAAKASDVRSRARHAGDVVDACHPH